MTHKRDLAAARGPVRWLAPAAFRMRKAIKRIPLVGSLALRIKNRYLRAYRRG